MRNKATRSLLLVVCAMLFNVLVYYGARGIAHGFPHLCLNSPADAVIPLLPWTLLIYFGGYLFWVVNYFLCIHFDTSGFNRFLISYFIGELVCFLVFVLLPTTMVRPELTGTAFFERMLALTYGVDSADNLLPSIHCFASWLCWIGVRRNPRIPGWYRYASLLIAVAICLSTLTVKQHVIADLAAGILLAELSYLLAGAVGGRLRRRRRTAPDADR